MPHTNEARPTRKHCAHGLDARAHLRRRNAKRRLCGASGLSRRKSRSGPPGARSSRRNCSCHHTGEAASLTRPPYTTNIDSPAAQARHHHLGWASFASDASTAFAVRLTRWCALERDENQLTSCKISSKISAAVASVSSEKGSSARTCPSARRAASRMSGMPLGARNGGGSNAV